jgi:hypothetical protein
VAAALGCRPSTRAARPPGVFLVLAAKTAGGWKVHRSAREVIARLEKRREHVYHYSFHIMDPVFGTR